MTFFSIYMSVWSAACAVALFILLRYGSQMEICQKKYSTFLFKPWKVITFIIATVLIVAVAPHSGDHTWDYYDAGFMAVFTYFTAPWTVGVFFRAIRRKIPFKKFFVAFCVWMFSASWSYDIYLFLRDGHYPLTWWSKMILSSILYGCGGLFWSLDWSKETGVFLSFKRDAWPFVSTGKVFPKIFFKALPYMAIVILINAAIIFTLNWHKF